jgi:hypothetical protein
MAKHKPPLTVEQILAWADAHHACTGRWPHNGSGPVAGVPGETWKAIDSALRGGYRGLPGGSSLVNLLRERRGKDRARPPLTVAKILRWADAHHRQAGAWPQSRSGPVTDAPGENWSALDDALRHGHRGLPGGSSLTWLLAQNGREDPAEPRKSGRTRPPRPPARPPLRVEQILAWADAHHARTGRWPTVASGPIPEAPGETWRAVSNALSHGFRGLPRGSSLPRLLQHHRGYEPGQPGPRPWTAEEDRLVQTLPPVEVAARTGHTLPAVLLRRRYLGVRQPGAPGAAGE